MFYNKVLFDPKSYVSSYLGLPDGTNVSDFLTFARDYVESQKVSLQCQFINQITDMKDKNIQFILQEPYPYQDTEHQR